MRGLPAISVVIPLYNAEKYIGECLESVLNQTFQNFEVIVVDDCSTDLSCAIVESYSKKFGGRLTLWHMKKNSGSGALPRNKGITLSCGEYIFFLDSDDMMTKTALEEIHTLAKNYNADVIYCEKHFEMGADGSNLKVTTRQTGNFVEEPCFETEDIAQRVNAMLNGRFAPSTCFKTVRRDFILANEIFFPHVCPSEDDIWTHALVFYARKFLRVPNAVYIRRLTENSVMRRKKNPQQMITFWLNPIFFGLKSLDKFLSKLEFFQTNPQYRYALLERFIKIEFYCMSQSTAQFEPFVVYDTIYQTFGKNFGLNDVLISALCATLNAHQKTLINDRRQFNEFIDKTQGRIAELERRDKENKAYIAELEKYIINLTRKE